MPNKGDLLGGDLIGGDLPVGDLTGEGEGSEPPLYSWTIIKFRQIDPFSEETFIHVKTGADQENAGALANEMYLDTTTMSLKVGT